jgi:hypothetical protein
VDDRIVPKIVFPFRVSGVSIYETHLLLCVHLPLLQLPFLQSIESAL